MIRVSAGTAACLGLKAWRAAVAPTTAYLLLGDRCVRRCAFCALAAGSGGDARRSVRDSPEDFAAVEGQENRPRVPGGTGEPSPCPGRDRRTVPVSHTRLGRVSWPAVEWGRLRQRLRSDAGKELRRVCLQAARCGQGIDELLAAVSSLRAAASLPVSVSAWLRDASEVAAVFGAGAERVAIALDAANPHVYRRLKQGSLAARVRLLLDCAARWPGRMTTHLIAGLGETEEELLSLAARLLREQVTVALFAFTPLPGTSLSGGSPPPLPSYRRVQAGLHLLRLGAVDFSALVFRSGRLVSFGLDPEESRALLEDGEAFRTAGCAGCNRPYYNESPRGVPYNYPRPLREEEASAALQALSL